jgi:hypothetical protein
MIPLFHHLKTICGKKLQNTKPTGDCGDAGEALEPGTLNYNCDYRLAYGSQPREKKTSLGIFAPLKKISRVVKGAARFAGLRLRYGKNALLRALAPPAPVVHRLRIIWRQNLRGTKRAVDFGKVCWRCEKKALAPLRPFFYDLKIIWRKNLGSIKRAINLAARYVKKGLLRVFAPLAPVYNGLKFCGKKILHGLKPAADFAASCWQYAKKIFLRVLAPLARVYNRVETAWQKILFAITGLPPADNSAQEQAQALEEAESGKWGYNRPYQYYDSSLSSWNDDWKSRAAVLASIVFGVAFIAQGSMAREALLFAGATLRSGSATASTLYSSTVGLLGDITHFTLFSKGGSGGGG